MKFPLLALPLLALPCLAEARCVTADDLSLGIGFKRNDGRSGTVVRDGDLLAINYAANSKTAWEDDRRTRMGIYELTWSWTPTDEYYVGGGPGGEFSFKFSGRPPVPASGTSWKSAVRVSESQDAGLESGPVTSRYNYDVTYSYQGMAEAKLSGCTYAILPVEATFSGKTDHFSRRWIYFPELGFGLETRFTDHETGKETKLGLTALTPLK